MQIAVAFDDERLGGQVASLLEGQGYRVARLGRLAPPAAAAAVRAARPSLLVLAQSLEGRAPEVLRALRGEPEMRRLPVLCVDTKAGSTDAVALLDAGADDAIMRPFQPPIFLARVRTLLRRALWTEAAPEEPAVVLAAGPLELRLLSRQALVSGKAVELTRLEFELLAHLAKHRDRAFRREELLAEVWNYPEGVETRTLDKHVEALRRKLGEAASLLQTVHGVGYRLSPPAS